jgi:hypothetical protein
LSIPGNYAAVAECIHGRLQSFTAADRYPSRRTTIPELQKAEITSESYAGAYVYVIDVQQNGPVSDVRITAQRPNLAWSGQAIASEIRNRVSTCPG